MAFTLGLEAAELTLYDKFVAFKQDFGIDLAMIKCAVDNTSPDQKAKYLKRCVKSCNVDDVKQSILTYSNALLISLVSFLTNSEFSLNIAIFR